MDPEIKIPFTLAPRIKYFNVDLRKLVQNLYAEKYTMLMKEIKEDLHKCREIYVHILEDSRLNTMSVLHKLMKRFNTNSI